MASSFACIAVLVLVCVQEAFAASAFNTNLNEHWENFKKTFQKQYSTGEEGTRRAIWEDHVAEIRKHNSEYDLGIHTYRKGLNEYADVQHDEFVKQMNGYKGTKISKHSEIFDINSNQTLPTTVDWRQKGLVTEVKNQKKCGSDWAFSTTGSLEGQHAKRIGKLVSLSEENLMDCSGPQGNNGCEGGLMDQAFEYVKENGGIDTEKSYPYTAKDGKCHYKKANSGATCTGYVDIPTGDEAALKKAVATIGPVSIAIDGSHLSFRFYESGVYNEPKCSNQQLDHAVLVVGYGTKNDQAYWLVKNSWGRSWGENGYIKMSRNNGNQCGIATESSFPLV